MMESNCKGRHTVTAKVDGETAEALDTDAERNGEFRADQIRRALSFYLRLRRGEFVCPHCDDPIQYNP